MARGNIVIDSNIEHDSVSLKLHALTTATKKNFFFFLILIDFFIVITIQGKSCFHVELEITKG